MDIITSAKNPLVTELKSLLTQKGRAEKGLILLPGEKLCVEALKSDKTRVRRLIVTESGKRDYSAVLESALSAGAEATVVSDSIMETLCEQKNPQGVLAAADSFFVMGSFSPVGRLVALDRVQDPGNVGTIIRSADAAGFSGVILRKGCADAFSYKVLRAAMGSVFRVSIFAPDDFIFELARIREAGAEILSSELCGGNMFSFGEFPEKLCLVIGNESAGVSPEVSALADVKIKIPMLGGAESLNAGVAASVLMYHLNRDKML
ncbi:MAG: RNA methyltransferase [Eubacteriales bacterium]|nr:RNA methyltransferase [Eubacteriales bacterium]MDD3882414.1 RNA methyltransferase [Eubacteriales bacterium]MDD4512365.1 RNA methyltransferase [Eubacteriales bacterium]